MPVVPTLAPNTRPSSRGKSSNPALTRPIVVIVTALDDCTSSVMIAPQKAPEKGVAAALPSTVRNDEPASAFSPSVMTVMPSRPDSAKNRNRRRHPRFVPSTFLRRARRARR